MDLLRDTSNRGNHRPCLNPLSGKTCQAISLAADIHVPTHCLLQCSSLSRAWHRVGPQKRSTPVDEWHQSLQEDRQTDQRQFRAGTLLLQLNSSAKTLYSLISSVYKGDTSVQEEFPWQQTELLRKYNNPPLLNISPQ